MDFVAIGEFKLELQSGLKLGSLGHVRPKQGCNMAATELGNLLTKLQFWRSHWWIQTGVSPETPNLGQILRF